MEYLCFYSGVAICKCGVCVGHVEEIVYGGDGEYGRIQLCNDVDHLPLL